MLKFYPSFLFTKSKVHSIRVIRMPFGSEPFLEPQETGALLVQFGAWRVVVPRPEFGRAFGIGSEWSGQPKVARGTVAPHLVEKIHQKTAAQKPRTRRHLYGSIVHCGNKWDSQHSSSSTS